MPKKRIKQSGNINKSGILTQNFRKELRVDSHLNNFVLRDVFHSEDEKNLDKIQFDDSNTIIFNTKTVNSTLGIERKYVEGDFETKNRVVNTPNDFAQDSSFDVQKIVNPEDYKHVIYSNYVDELSSDKFKSFNDEFIDYEINFSNSKKDLVDKATDYEKIIYNFKNKRYEVKKNFEEININFNKNYLNLSFNLNNDVSDYSNTTSSKNLPLVKNHENLYFLALNNNTVYLDNNSINDSNTYYSLGNNKYNYFSSINNFSKAAITNNPLTLYSNDIIGNPTNGKAFFDTTSLSNPIINFGFPFSKRFRGNNEVEIDVSNFINEDFMLEKIYVEFKLKNFAVSTDAGKPCLNTLNFFIVNQRGNIDTLNKHFENLYSVNNEEIQNSSYWNQNSSTLEEVGVTMGSDEKSQPDCSVTRVNFEKRLLSQGQVDGGDGKVNVTIVPGLNKDGVYNHQELNFQDAKHREIVSNIKIVNVGSTIKNNIDNKNFDYFKSLNGADHIVYTDVVDPSKLNNLNVSVKDYIINDSWQEVKILSSVKGFKGNSNLKRFSQFEIYPSQSSKRAGIPINSERSINSESGFSFDRASVDDERGQNLDYGSNSSNTIFENNYQDNPYILRAKDKLIFGFNFCPSMDLQNIDNSDLILQQNNQYTDYNGRDVIMLDLSNLKIKLLGRYVAEDNVFTIKKSEFESKNIKKINELATNVVDNAGLPPQFMMNNNYYNCFTSSSSLYPKLVSRGDNTFGGFVNIPQVSSSSISYGLSEMNGNMYVTGSSDVSANIVSYLRDDKKHKDNDFYLNYKFKVDHFGFMSDKINDNKHYSYLNTKTSKATYNIEKYFRKSGLWIQKNESAGDVINSYNKDKNARLRTEPLTGNSLTDLLLSAFSEFSPVLS